MDDGEQFGPEVARLQLPLPVKGLELLTDWLEDAYGQDLVMHQDDRWLVITQPKR